MSGCNGESGTPVFEFKDDQNRWHRFAGWEVPSLALAGALHAEQEVRFFDEEGKEIVHTARELPDLPLRELLEDYFDVIRRYIASTARANGSVEGVLRCSQSVRKWAPGPMSWFANYVDFGRAVLCQLTGLKEVAGRIYQDISAEYPDATDLLLHRCVNHNLACLEIRWAQPQGLRRLAGLAPEMETGPTYYTIAELIRFFHLQGRPSQLITEMLLASRVLPRWAAQNAEAAAMLRDGQWEPAYEAAWRSFRNLARQCGGLHDLTGIQVMHSHPTSRRKSNGLVQLPTHGWWGVLTTLGTEDIPEVLAWSDSQTRETATALGRRLQVSRTLAEQGHVSQAEEAVKAVAEAARDDPNLAAIRAEASCQQEQLLRECERIERTRRDEDTASLWERFQYFRNAPEAEGDYQLQEMMAFAEASLLAEDDWRPIVDAAQETLQERQAESSRREGQELLDRIQKKLACQSYDEAEVLVRRLVSVDDPRIEKLRDRLLERCRVSRAKKAFREGLDAIEEDPGRVEAMLTVAAQDKRYEEMAPPLIVASHFFCSNLNALWSGLSGLEEYRSKLLKRISLLSEPRYQNQEVIAQLWELIAEFAEMLVSCSAGRDVAIEELVDSLCQRAEQFRSLPGTVEWTLRVLQRLRDIGPGQVINDSPISLGLQRLAVQKALLDGETDRASISGDLNQAAERFLSAIWEDPDCQDAWVRLADCRVEQHRVPRRYRINWLKALRRSIEQMTPEERAKRAENADEWICGQVEDLAAQVPERLRRATAQANATVVAESADAGVCDEIVLPEEEGESPPCASARTGGPSAVPLPARVRQALVDVLKWVLQVLRIRRPPTDHRSATSDDETPEEGEQ